MVNVRYMIDDVQAAIGFLIVPDIGTPAAPDHPECSQG
jgi:hypothetical protein